MHISKIVEVTFSVNVTVDESKFTLDFIENFKRYFHDLDDIDEHIGYIATLAVRDRLDEFTEGYGDLSSMGIKARVNDVCVEVEG